MNGSKHHIPILEEIRFFVSISIGSTEQCPESFHLELNLECEITNLSLFILNLKAKTKKKKYFVENKSMHIVHQPSLHQFF